MVLFLLCLIAPDHAAIRLSYYNHIVLVRYAIRMEAGSCPVIIRVQDDPFLRILVWFVFNVPHRFIPVSCLFKIRYVILYCLAGYIRHR